MERGKKRLAVLVGCNYPHTQFKLHGCINDVLAMKNVLEKHFGFEPNHVRLLTDAPGSLVIPTGANIKAALNEMVKQAAAGDVLFFHFSGHGSRIASLEPGQPYSEYEAIVPCDLNLITDMDLRHLIKRLPEGSSFTILSDSCHSGGMIDKDKEQIGPSTMKGIGLPPPVFFRGKALPFGIIQQCLQSVTGVVHTASEVIHTASDIATGIESLFSGIFGKEVSMKFLPQHESDISTKSLNEEEGILLSGCQANETSADLEASPITRGKAHGAFTFAVLQVLEEYPTGLSNKQLVMKTRKFIHDCGFEQHACLYSSDGNADAYFLANQYHA
ncbi:hypothetical protein REPUB_Repub03eG0274200 [Reevesia pubescens]